MSHRWLIYTAAAVAVSVISVGCKGCDEQKCGAGGFGGGGAGGWMERCDGPDVTVGHTTTSTTTTTTTDTTTGQSSTTGTGTTVSSSTGGGGQCFNGAISNGEDAGLCCHADVTGDDMAMVDCVGTLQAGFYSYGPTNPMGDQVSIQFMLSGPLHVGAYTDADFQSWSVTFLNGSTNWSASYIPGTKIGSMTMNVSAISNQNNIDFPTATIEAVLPAPMGTSTVAVHAQIGP